MKQFIIKNWLLLLVAAAAFAAAVWIHQYTAQKQAEKDVQKVSVDGTVKTKTALNKDDAGRTHAVTETVTVNKELAAIIASRDSALKIIKIKDKQLLAYSKAVSALSFGGTLSVTPTPSTDSASPCPERYSFSWNDQWMELKGAVGDTNWFHVYGTDTLLKVDYWKRSKVLGLSIGAKHYFADFYHTNQDIEMTGATNLEVRKDPNHYNVSGSVGIGYPLNNLNVTKPSLIIGITVGRTIFKF